MDNIQIFSDRQELAQAVAEVFVQTGTHAITKEGRFTVSLAGGSTPIAAYQLLGSPGFSTRLDWSKTHIFWGDERCVPPDHPESNYRMACETLIEKVPVPDSNIHRMEGELNPNEAARRYDKNLRNFFGNTPHFDLVLLGMGTDGHTASLFPGSAALHETQAWAIANHVDKLSSWRITLTPTILNQAQKIIFIVSGENKARPLHQVLMGEYQPEVYPSQLIKPFSGRLTWLLDKPAAKFINL
jgi:6-phosphogluconolactonase